MAGLLAGLRVLDLTNVLAGPFCCYQLAQLGAEVIKIETPGTGDLARQLGADPELNRRLMGASFLAQNAGKRSITLNLKNAKAREAFTRLVKTSDVVVENFRPGVMDRLELGYERLKAIKPDLIYCAISGFGQDGPLRLNPAYDQIIQGLSGVMSVTGDAQSAPLRVGYPVADTMGGITAAYAISAALFRRERSGEGEFIDVSMLESTLVAMGWVVSNWLIAGVRPEPLGNENMTASPSGTFRTGAGLLNIAANQQQQFEALCKLIGRPELAIDRALCRPRGSQAPSRRAEHGDRAGAGGAPGGGMVRADEQAMAFRPARCSTCPRCWSIRRSSDARLLSTFDDVPQVDRAVSVVRSGFRLASGDPAPASPPPALGADTERASCGAWLFRKRQSKRSRATRQSRTAAMAKSRRSKPKRLRKNGGRRRSST